MYPIVVQVRGLSSFKPCFNHHFLHKRMHVTVRNMTVFIHSFDMFEFLILPFDDRLSVLIFSKSSVFSYFTLYFTYRSTNS